MAHVLVVEDDRMNARLFEVILRRRGGFEVTTTEDVAEVFRLAKGRLIDLIIMDVSLANCIYEGKAVDGLEIAKKLKTDTSTADIPIILATAHAMRGDRERFLTESKADEYVSKPVIDQVGLIEMVKSFLKKKEPSPA
jgi:CheY-like chemotaxis protein